MEQTPRKTEGQNSRWSLRTHTICVLTTSTSQEGFAVGVVTKVILGKQHTYTSTYRREGAMTDLSTGTTNVPLGEAMSFIGVTYRSMGEYKMTSSKSTPAELGT